MKRQMAKNFLKRFLKIILKNKFTEIYLDQLLIELRYFRLRSGYHINQVQKYESILLKHGYSLNNFNKILEFGCGHGRLIGAINNLFPNVECFGSDIHKPSLILAKKNNPNIKFIQNDINPPLSFDNEQFDLIFSHSVFTVLSEQSHCDWLKEITKKLKPGGICLHAIHTVECLKLMNIFSPDSINKYELPKPFEDFISSLKNYYYTNKNKQTLGYELAIIPEIYIRENWPKYSSLQLIDIELGAIQCFPEGCHDLVMLKKNI